MVLPSRFGAMEDEEHFVPAYEEEMEVADHSLSGSLGSVVESRRLSSCIDCSDRGSVFGHLKTHVLRHHVCLGAYCFLYPLFACWVCRTQEIPQHLIAHGRFDTDIHMPEFHHLFTGFLVLVMSKLQLRSHPQLFGLVSSFKLLRHQTVFFAGGVGVSSCI